MSHRVHSTDCGTSCLFCGGHFHCDKCREMSESRTWQEHDCQADQVADEVPCEETPCPGMDGDGEGSHHWSQALPPDWRRDDPSTDYLVVECDFCGAVHGVRERACGLCESGEASVHNHGNE